MMNEPRREDYGCLTATVPNSYPARDAEYNEPERRRGNKFCELMTEQENIALKLYAVAVDIAGNLICHKPSDIPSGNPECLRDAIAKNNDIMLLCLQTMVEVYENL